MVFILMDNLGDGAAVTPELRERFWNFRKRREFNIVNARGTDANAAG